MGVPDLQYGQERGLVSSPQGGANALSGAAPRGNPNLRIVRARSATQESKASSQELKSDDDSWGRNKTPPTRPRPAAPADVSDDSSDPTTRLPVSPAETAVHMATPPVPIHKDWTTPLRRFWQSSASPTLQQTPRRQRCLPLHPPLFMLLLMSPHRHA